MRWALFLIAVAACRDAGGASRKRPALDDYGAVPAFSLHDQNDAVVSEDWLRGHATIVDFVFTRCDTICPALSLKMSRLDEQLKGTPGAQLLSFSVDPTHDTPPVLAAYASHYHADAARWRFVTGQYDAVKTLVEGALMTAMEDAGKPLPSGAPDIKHGGQILLIGPDLHIRGIYDSDDGDRLADVVEDAKQLVR
jgi:protein SCO1/2